MTHSSTEIQNISSDEAILVEYLDGDLSLNDRQIVENRLAKEPEFRETLTRLEASWNCLDLLEREEADKEFVESTLETVVFSTEQSIAELQSLTKRRFSWKQTFIGILILLPLIVIFCFAFITGEHLAPDNNFLLRVAMPVITRLDMYLMVLDDNPELIRLLAERRLFLPPLPEDAEPIDPKEYLPSPSVRMMDFLSLYPSFSELKRRAKQIEDLDESLYNRFYNNSKKFKELSPQKHEAIKELHESIERSPRHYELSQTLQNYYNWRKSLQSYEKADLRKPLPAADRVEQIAALKKRLEANQPEESDAAPLLSEILKSSEGINLAKVLDDLPMQEKEIILDLTPAQTITVLKQISANNMRE